MDGNALADAADKCDWTPDEGRLARSIQGKADMTHK